MFVVQGPAQPGRASFYGGTGWLLTSALVVVPAHLVEGPNDARDWDAAAERVKSFVARFDFDAPDSIGMTVPVQKLELLDHKLDLAILRLGAEVTDRAPLQVNPDPPAPGPGFLSMIHHPGLGPKKLSMRGGRIIESDAHQVTYVIASQAGSAGAPVFDMEWRVVATHRAFQSYRPTPDAEPIRAKLGTATSALLKALREIGPALQSLWREVVAAQPALKVIDSTLYAKLQELEGDAAAVVPMVIQLVGPSVTLDDVPGLQVGTRDDHLVTAMGTKASLDALAQRPGVLSVKASNVSGSIECGVSIPHIGATKIHEELHERGEETLIALIDNGLDVFHQSFRDGAGKTRVVAFWDQKDARAPAGDGAQKAQSTSAAGQEMVDACGLAYGALYVAQDLQGFIDGAPLPATFPRVQAMSHGTTVGSIAAGRRTGDEADVHFPGGIAPAASLIVVRYDLQESSVGYSMGHIDALSFIDKLASRLNKPVVVNISNGMNAGAHDGTSPVEQKCQEFTGNGQAAGRIIVKSAGNERGQGATCRAQGRQRQHRRASLALHGQHAGRQVGPRDHRAVVPVQQPVPVSREASDRRIFSGDIPGRHGEGAPRASRQRQPDPCRAARVQSRERRRVAAPRDLERRRGRSAGRRVDARDQRCRDPRPAADPRLGGRDVEPRSVLSRSSRRRGHHHHTRHREGRDHGRCHRHFDADDEAVWQQLLGTEPEGPGKARSRGARRQRPRGARRLGTRRGPAGDGEIGNERCGTARHRGDRAWRCRREPSAGNAQFNSNQIRSALRQSLRHLSVWNETTGFGELDARELLRLLDAI